MALQRLHAAMLQPVSRRWPGMALCATVALAAGFIAALHGGPHLLYALLFGVCFHFLAEDERTQPGIAFCSSTVLRFGVALLGARITLAQIAALGWGTVAVVVSAVASTVFAGLFIARRLGFTREQGVLSGGAVAICGASAALALAAVLPRSREQERFTLVVVVCITTLSTLAMLLYPTLAAALHLAPQRAALFLGGTIHDVAQVTAAGTLMGAEVAEAATLVKLCRVALLSVVAGLVSVSALGRAQRTESGSLPLLPGYLQLFLLLVTLRSLGWLPTPALQPLSVLSGLCLAVAIAALGVRTSLPALVEAGWRAVALLLLESLWLAAWVLGFAMWMR
ncbi:MAG TPA: putative sulfate exporter family transporter [Albitalea sp.]|nr:putative sulfate exporter family transporter [Albitalea sp.]